MTDAIHASNIQDVETKDQAYITTTDAEHPVDLKAGVSTSVGLALIEQTNVIPTTGARKVTTKWEYWTYCAFCGSFYRGIFGLADGTRLGVHWCTYVKQNVRI
jgi:hypothetical protein